jgi:GAF domain-containing protein
VVHAQISLPFLRGSVTMIAVAVATQVPWITTVSDSPDASRPAPSDALSMTTLGPIGSWPTRLRSAFDVCLQSTVPAFVWWGPELVQLYNEAGAPLLHAQPSLGTPAREAWAHGWPIMGPVVERVLLSGDAAVARGVAIAPGDGASASHVDIYYSAIRGDGGRVDGLYAIAVDSLDGASHGSLHQRMLNAAVRLTGSDFASLQLLDPERDELWLIAHHGFPADTAAFWDRVGVESGTACGKALERNQRIVVPDVEEAPFIRGTIDLRVFQDAGIRAVQTTPLIDKSHRLVGMLSTHWRKPHKPAPIELERFDVLAREVANVLACDT